MTSDRAAGSGGANGISPTQGYLRTAALTARTAAHLRPAQIGHRGRLRLLRVAEERWPRIAAKPVVPSGRSAPGWPTSFRPIAASLPHGDAANISKGRFSFLGEERYLGSPADWRQVGAARLWRFNLQYMEWAWALYQADDSEWARATFAKLWESWHSANPVGDRDAWSPYVASLRLWVLCAMFDRLVKATPIETDVSEQISWHAGYVRAHLELDVGGNHLVKNLKSLAGAGVFLGRSDLVDFAQSRMNSQVGIQVLADGGHYERSPSYHCQVLEDLIDVEALRQSAGYQSSTRLTQCIEAMRRWLGAMIGDDGEVAMFNDAVPVGAPRIAALSPTAPPVGPLIALGASGYVVLRPDSRTQVICDVGDPCPPNLPAHAHADCLSFEMWLDGTKSVVDTATSTYEPGRRRDYERSTAAHSTVQVDGEDQTEVWGAFRAARLARATLEHIAVEGNKIVVVASHDGYRRLPGSPLHRRRWTASPGSLAVNDIVTGRGSHQITGSLYLPMEHGLSLIEGQGGHMSVEKCELATGFGECRAARRYLLDAGQVTLPATMSWRLEW